MLLVCTPVRAGRPDLERDPVTRCFLGQGARLPFNRQLGYADRNASKREVPAGGHMPRVSAVPYSKMDSELKAIVHASDEALNGSEWVQYFCHPTELYKSFVKFYYAHVATEEYGISWKLSEMMRHMVAVHNTCTL